MYEFLESEYICEKCKSKNKLVSFFTSPINPEKFLLLAKNGKAKNNTFQKCKNCGHIQSWMFRLDIQLASFILGGIIALVYSIIAILLFTNSVQCSTIPLIFIGWISSIFILPEIFRSKKITDFENYGPKNLNKVDQKGNVLLRYSVDSNSILAQPIIDYPINYDENGLPVILAGMSWKQVVSVLGNPITAINGATILGKNSNDQRITDSFEEFEIRNWKYSIHISQGRVVSVNKWEK